ASIGDKDDDDELEGGEDHPVYEVHDSEDEGDVEYNREDKEKHDKEEAKAQGKGMSEK
ncbi:hypothetical protein KI387_008436, partial [Taxus chinensis]